MFCIQYNIIKNVIQKESNIQMPVFSPKFALVNANHNCVDASQFLDKLVTMHRRDRSLVISHLVNSREKEKGERLE